MDQGLIKRFYLTGFGDVKDSNLVIRRDAADQQISVAVMVVAFTAHHGKPIFFRACYQPIKSTDKHWCATHCAILHVTVDCVQRIIIGSSAEFFPEEDVGNSCIVQ